MRTPPWNGSPTAARLVPLYLLVAIALLLRVLVTGRWYLAQLVYPALGSAS
jgi:hypothetical protein